MRQKFKYQGSKLQQVTKPYDGFFIGLCWFILFAIGAGFLFGFGWVVALFIK